MRIIDVFYNEMNELKRVGKPTITQEELENFAFTIDAINNAPAHQSILNGELIEDYKIDKRLMFLIQPSKVGIATTIEYLDLRDMESFSLLDDTILNGMESMNEVSSEDSEVSMTSGGKRNVTFSNNPRIVDPSTFMQYSAKIANTFKSNVSLESVKEARKPMKLDDVYDRTVVDGYICPDKGRNFWPLPLLVTAREDMYYTVSLESHIKTYLTHVFTTFNQ